MEPPIPVKALGEDGKGRPRINHREVLNGILLVLSIEAAWQELEQIVLTPPGVFSIPGYHGTNRVKRSGDLA